jgi:hypothetical protein
MTVTQEATDSRGRVCLAAQYCDSAPALATRALAALTLHRAPCDTVLLSTDSRVPPPCVRPLPRALLPHEPHSVDSVIQHTTPVLTAGPAPR